MSKFDNPPSESSGKRYAEDIFESLPDVEIGKEIKRVTPTQLTGGRDRNLKISVDENLGRQGWSQKALDGVKRGDTVRNYQSGEIFRVLGVKGNVIEIQSSESEFVNYITPQTRNVPSHEYQYQLNDNAGHSKKINVYDAAFLDRSLDTSDFMVELLAAIPADCMHVFDEIQLHKIATQKSGISKIEGTVFARNNVITLYIHEDIIANGPPYPIKAIIEIFYHEMGHAAVKYLKQGSPNPGEEWRKTMRAGGKPMSEYSEKVRYPQDDDKVGEVEDFAETFRMFCARDGAVDPQSRSLNEFTNPRFPKMRAVFKQLRERQNMGRIQRMFNRSKDIV